MVILSSSRLALMGVASVMMAFLAGPRPMAAQTLFQPVAREATLYRNRASVFFADQITLAAGKHTLEHKEASPTLLAETLRASSNSPHIVFQGISSFLETVDHSRNPDLQQLEKRIQALDRDILKTQYQADRLKTDLNGIDRYYELLTTAIARQSGGTLETRENARQILMARKLKQTEQAGWVQETLRKQKEELAVLQRDLQEKKNRLSHRRRTVQITLYAREKTTARIGYHAILPDAGWNVSYSLRLSGGNELKYYAEAYQKTDQDWKGIDLFFSTAEPTLPTERPPLRPLAASLERVGRQEGIVQEQDAALDTLSSEPEEESAQETLLVFKVGQASLKSGNEKHLFLLATYQPQLSDSRVRLAGKLATGMVYRLKHTGTSPLLAGPVDLIRDAGFSGRSRIKRTPPGSNFQVSLAGAAFLKQDRSVAHRRETSLGGKQIFHTVVRNQIQNNSSRSVPLEIQERLPVSEVAEVQVELKDASAWQARNEHSGVRIRQIELQPGQKWEYQFHFTVTAPSNHPGTIYGD